MTTAAQRRADSIKIMKKIYDASRSNLIMPLTLEEIHKPDFSPWPENYVRGLVWYWVQKSFVRAGGADPVKTSEFFILQSGIDFVENKLLKR